jgi:hypothetical protein
MANDKWLASSHVNIGPTSELEEQPKRIIDWWTGTCEKTVRRIYGGRRRRPRCGGQQVGEPLAVVNAHRSRAHPPRVGVEVREGHNVGWRASSDELAAAEMQAADSVQSDVRRVVQRVLSWCLVAHLVSVRGCPPRARVR